MFARGVHGRPTSNTYDMMRFAHVPESKERSERGPFGGLEELSIGIHCSMIAAECSLESNRNY